MVYKTKYFFSKKELEEMYVNQKLSLSQVAKKLNCSGTTIFRALEKFGIEKRPVDYRKILIDKEILEDLYWNKGMKPREIAEKFGIKNERTIRKKMEKYGLKRKTLSEAMTLKMKSEFSGDLAEKAYFLGLRTGDFHCKTKNLSPRFQTSTTHPAQVELLRNSFEKYGEICKYFYQSKLRKEPEWFIYIDLHPSFNFLLEKPEKIPDWIMENDEYFYNFFAAYMDCEGYWCIINNRKYGKDYDNFRFVFGIGSMDKDILWQIKEKLIVRGFFALLYLSREKGSFTSYGIYNKDFYQLIIYRKEHIKHLIQILLKYSKHPEKIQKMKFILENINLVSWNEIGIGWNKIRDNIKKEILK
ncbi:hypothetical protein HYX16_06320 [Candidatus Woesearchaeota archaeon]|nr:hypothetical protein [Candidatus Woesearchaeota archaeon]